MPLDKTYYILTPADVWTYANRKLSENTITGRVNVVAGANLDIQPAVGTSGSISFAFEVATLGQLWLFDGANTEIVAQGSGVTDRTTFPLLTITRNRYARMRNNDGLARNVSYIYIQLTG